MSESQQGQYDKRRVSSAAKYIDIGGKPMAHRLYLRYMGDETELWMFGVGLGDTAAMQQIGETFLDMVDASHDPCLGRIMLSYGSTATSFYVFKGDWNVWWAWGDRPDYIDYYLSRVTVKPSLILCGSHKVEHQMRERGFDTIYLPLGVGKRFRPLGLERSGLGYCGNPIKSREQMVAIVDPVADRLEWNAKHADDKWLTLEELNTWYNGKQIVFGMINEQSWDLEIVPNRFWETLASGTPLITFRHPGIPEVWGDYPYQTTCADGTLALVDEVLGDYPRHLARFAEYSERVRREHNYTIRLEKLFNYLAHST